MPVICSAHRKPDCSAEACAARRRRFDRASLLTPADEPHVHAADLAPFDTDGVNLSDYDFGAYDSTTWGGSADAGSSSSSSDSGSSSSCD